MSKYGDEPMAMLAVTREEVNLLCCHCKEAVLLVSGYDAFEFCKTLTGRLVCEPCWKQIAAGEVLPLRAVKP
jgi:hypothetical protein